MGADPETATQAPHASLAGPALAALLAAAAYLPWLWPQGGGRGFEELMFRPGTLPAVGVVGLAVFVCWLRRPALRRLPEDPAPRLAAALAALGAGLYVWALLTGGVWLLLSALALHLLALAAMLGPGACAVLAGPALILLAGTPLPGPLEDEWVWQLQRASAGAAHALLGAAGHEFVRIGVTLHGPEHSFHVIDGCSGASGIAILVVVALLVRELFPEAGRRGWLLIALAPLLGFALNAFRVAYIAASPVESASAAADSGHTGQGMAVLMGGTALLYLAGWALAASAPRAVPSAGLAAAVVARGWPWRVASIGFGALALLSLAVPRFSEAESVIAQNFQFPTEKGRWEPGPLKPDLDFTGVVQPGVQGRYHLKLDRKNTQIVDLLIGYEQPGAVTSFRMLSSKLLFPGPNWERESQADVHLLTLDLDATLGHFSRGRRGAVSISWRLRDCGLTCESLRAWLALDASPWRRERPRAAVRVVAYAAHEGPYVLGQARELLDQFLREFRPELQAL